MDIVIDNLLKIQLNKLNIQITQLYLNRMKRISLLLFILISTLCEGQELKTLDYPDSLIKKRRNAVIISESIATISSLALLHEVWYKNYNTGKFHLFNDGKEWLQVDKTGHAMVSYYMGIAGIEALKWSGVKKNKATIFGGSLGLLYLTGIEFLDGYSDRWGFSGYDMLANTSGTALAIGQNLIWDEQRIKLKFSTHQTEFAAYRPNLLGSNFTERILKDYNGQTYWLSLNIKDFLKEESNFPSWLNVAFGYGAEQMVTGNVHADWCLTNPICDDLTRYRQFYLSFDADLSKIEYKRKFFKLLFGSFGFLKFPAPTIEFNKNGLKGYLLYY